MKPFSWTSRIWAYKNKCKNPRYICVVWILDIACMFPWKLSKMWDISRTWGLLTAITFRSLPEQVSSALFIHSEDFYSLSPYLPMTVIIVVHLTNSDKPLMQQKRKNATAKFSNVWTLSTWNTDRYPLLFKHQLKGLGLILNTATSPVIWGCVHFCNRVFVFFVFFFLLTIFTL